MVQCSDENETLVITQAAKGNIVVQATNSLIASKNAKLDHHLTYAEYMFMKNHFLMYASRVQQNWHNKAAQKKAYNIGIINKELMNKIVWELDARDIQLGLEQPEDQGPVSPDPGSDTEDLDPLFMDNQGPHDKSRVVMERNGIPFDRGQHLSAQNAWADMKNMQIKHLATSHPCGTNLTPPFAPETIKGNLSTEMAKSFAGTSSSHRDAPASFIHMNAQVAET
ncbi:hypothetical protein V8B97DRAFT_1917474 [Scleroderma yunnanense]